MVICATTRHGVVTGESSRMLSTGLPLLRHEGDSLLTAHEHLVDAYEAEHGNNSEDHAEIDAWLEQFLGKGSQKANDVYAAADAAGFSKDQAKRSKKRLGIEARRPGGEGPWFWSMPESNDSERGSNDSELGSKLGSVSQNVLPSSLVPCRSVTVRLGSSRRLGS